MFLRISKNSLENTCTRICFLTKLQAAPTTLLKKRLWHSCFPENFANFSRKAFLKKPTLVAASILYLNYYYNLNLCLSKLSTFPKQQYSYYGISNISYFVYKVGYSLWITWITFLQLITSCFTVKLHVLFMSTNDLRRNKNSQVFKLSWAGCNHLIDWIWNFP